MHLHRYYRRTAVPTIRSIRMIRETPFTTRVDYRLLHVVANLYTCEDVYASRSNL